MNDFRNETLTGARAGSYDVGLRRYMLGVYNYMALGIAVAGIFAMLLSNNEAFVQTMFGNPILRFAPFVAILAIGWFGGKVIYSGSTAMAHVMFWAYAAAWGLLIVPALYVFQTAGEASVIYRAFFITASVFAGMSLFGYTTKKNLMGWGSFLFMATLGLLVAIIVNFIFFKSGMISFITSGLVVLVFSAVTAYETQMIKKLYSQDGTMNDRSTIFGAFMLFGSFATLFIHIMNLLGFMSND